MKGYTEGIGDEPQEGITSLQENWKSSTVDRQGC